MKKGNFWLYFTDKGSCGFKHLVFSGSTEELNNFFIPIEVAEGLRQLQEKEPELMEKMFALTEERFERASYTHRAINDQTLSPDERVEETQKRETDFAIWEKAVWLPAAEIIYNKLIFVGIPPEFIM